MAGRPAKGEGDPRIALFVDEYMHDFVGSAAARRVGVDAKSAAKTASLWLKLPWVQAEITKRREKRSDKLEITAERVLREWARIAFLPGDAAVKFGPDGITVKSSAELTPDVLAAVAEVSETRNESGGTIRIKFHSKTAALEALTKHLGLDAPVKHELTGPGGGPIEVATRSALESKLHDLGKRLGPEKPG